MKGKNKINIIKCPTAKLATPRKINDKKAFFYHKNKMSEIIRVENKNLKYLFNTLRSNSKIRYRSINNNFINFISTKEKLVHLIIVFFVLFTISNSQIRYNSNNYDIIIRVSSKGYRKLFHNTNNLPDAIYINGDSQRVNYNYYTINSTNDIIKLRWNYKFDTLKQMFYYCEYISEINLFNFDISHITDLSYMFQGCTSLTSLNISNFDTSNVNDMSYMFYGCSGLRA